MVSQGLLWEKVEVIKKNENWYYIVMEEDKIQVLRRSGDLVKYPIRNGDMSMPNTVGDVVDKSNLDSDVKHNESQIIDKNLPNNQFESTKNNLDNISKNYSSELELPKQSYNKGNLDKKAKSYSGEHEALFAYKTKSKLLPLLHKIEELSERKVVLLEEISIVDSDLQAISQGIKALQEQYEEEVKSIKERFELFETSLSLINKMIERK